MGLVEVCKIGLPGQWWIDEIHYVLAGRPGLECGEVCSCYGSMAGVAEEESNGLAVLGAEGIGVVEVIPTVLVTLYAVEVLVAVVKLTTLSRRILHGEWYGQINSTKNFPGTNSTKVRDCQNMSNLGISRNENVNVKTCQLETVLGTWRLMDP